MKKKIIILAVIVIIGICGFAIYKITAVKNFTIPENYKLKLQDNKSYVDGPNITYYIYDNKIITENISYFPLGHPKGTKCHTIIVYNNVITNNIKEINDIYKLIENKKGYQVYKSYN